MVSEEGKRKFRSLPCRRVADLRDLVLFSGLVLAAEAADCELDGLPLKPRRGFLPLTAVPGRISLLPSNLSFVAQTGYPRYTN